MRILLLAGSYPPETGGISQFMYSFAEGLIAQGVQVEIIANPRLPERGYLKRIQACRKEVSQRLATRSYDRIVASSWSPYAVAMPQPFDVFCHGMDLLEPAHSLPYRALMKRTLRRAARVLANSQYTANLARTFGARTASIVVLHPGVDGDRFVPAEPQSSTKIILSIGRLVERKGFDIVIQAMPKVLAKFPDARYICAGDGPDHKRLQELAASLNVASQVIWPGEIDEARKMSLYHSAEVFVMPNRIVEKDGSVEGFGIVFLEAAACAIPVIAGNSGGTPDVIVDQMTGYLVEPSDINEVAARIIELLSNPKRASQMGRAGRERALKDFREEQVAERYLASIGEG